MRPAIPRYFPQNLSLDAVCAAATRCFTKHGFHGTTIRQIATSAGLSVPGLYHHYPSKDAILIRLGEIAMEELDAAARHAVTGKRDTIERFDHLIACLVQFHVEFQDIAFVTFSEIRALPEPARGEHIRARKIVQQILADVVDEGAQNGVFRTENPQHAARALSNICMGISQWYRTKGALDVDELVTIYTSVCRDTVGYART